MLLDLEGYGPLLLEGTKVTLQLALLSLALAVVLGLLGAFAKLRPRGVLKAFAQGYTSLIRGIPDLVMMLLLFFGGQVLINALAVKVGYEDYIDISPFLAGSVTIGVIFGAYMTETFRGAFLAIPKGQIEAATSFGMMPWQIAWRIQLPQMMRYALPGFSNNWLVLVKSTAIVSVIGLDDVVRKASLAAGATHKPFTFWIAVAGIYLLITSVSIGLQKALAHRLEAPMRLN